MQPAIRGTLEILESAQKSGTVARIVITSSFAALQDYAKGVRPDYTYSVKDWCPLTYEDGKVSPLEQRATTFLHLGVDPFPSFFPFAFVQNATDQLLVYVASKKLAEEAAWLFMETEKPSFTLTTLVFTAFATVRGRLNSSLPKHLPCFCPRVHTSTPWLLERTQHLGGVDSFADRRGRAAADSPSGPLSPSSTSQFSISNQLKLINCRP